jgi:hypothetical protein
MCSRDDTEVRRILDEVVLLACPVNPDGYELVCNAYRATRSMTIPVLYQRYIGHDNNRDFYACNQIEAQNVNRVFYRDWRPQIVYNHHQTAPKDTIIFTPPFRDPHNYLVDPMVVRGIEIVSAHMNQRFAAEGKPGVISRSGAPYSGWWNGGLRSTNYFHNIIGILTESFGKPEPTPIGQPLERRLPYGDYPDPVPAQVWHARQTVEYLQTANFAILDYAARYRRELLRDMHTMATRAIARGRRTGRRRLSLHPPDGVRSPPRCGGFPRIVPRLRSTALVRHVGKRSRPAACERRLGGAGDRCRGYTVDSRAVPRRSHDLRRALRAGPSRTASRGPRHGVARSDGEAARGGPSGPQAGPPLSTSGRE